MSLRDLARAYLTRQEPAGYGQLSQRDTPRRVPAGQNASIPYSSRSSAVPRERDSGTVLGTVGQTVPVGQCEALGTVGTGGTLGTAPGEDARARVEAELDRMAAENERRRDWSVKPVEGWREGKLTIRSAVTGKTNVIQLPRGRGRT